eukprot:Selendium_serpulae@DN6126_c0_g2_i3.p1
MICWTVSLPVSVCQIGSQTRRKELCKESSRQTRFDFFVMSVIFVVLLFNYYQQLVLFKHLHPPTTKICFGRRERGEANAPTDGRDDSLGFEAAETKKTIAEALSESGSARTLPQSHQSSFHLVGCQPTACRIDRLTDWHVTASCLTDQQRVPQSVDSQSAGQYPVYIAFG